MDNYYDIFKTNLKFYREQKNLSQRELAIQADCTDGSIGMIESGKSKPSFDMIVKLAVAMDIHPADLFLRDASKSQEQLKDSFEDLFFSEIPQLVEKKFSLRMSRKNMHP